MIIEYNWIDLHTVYLIYWAWFLFGITVSVLFTLASKSSNLMSKNPMSLSPPSLGSIEWSAYSWVWVKDCNQTVSAWWFQAHMLISSHTSCFLCFAKKQQISKKMWSKNAKKSQKRETKKTTSKSPKQSPQAPWTQTGIGPCGSAPCLRSCADGWLGKEEEISSEENR